MLVLAQQTRPVGQSLSLPQSMMESGLTQCSVAVLHIAPGGQLAGSAGSHVVSDGGKTTLPHEPRMPASDTDTRAAYAAQTLS